MKIILISVFVSISSLANMAFAQKDSMLKNYKWKNRIILVFTTDADGKEEQQLSLFKEQSAGMEDRDLMFFRIKESKVIGPEDKSYPAYTADQLRNKYRVQQGEFTVILIGKDGTEKPRQHDILKTEKLFATIDAMPMRQREMRKGDGD